MENYSQEQKKALVVSYLKEKAIQIRFQFSSGGGSEYFNPLPELQDLLTSKLSVESTQALKQTSQVLKDLENTGHIHCLRNSRGTLQKIRILNLDKKPLFVRKAEKEKTQPEKVAPTVTESMTVKPIKRLVVINRKKGAARILKKATEKGHRNEERFGRILEKLKIRFSEVCPEISLEMERSGHHNPEKGKIDLRDKAGEDFSLYYKTPNQKFRLISDVKSSFKKAERRNRDIILFKSQKDVDIKKAIAVNEFRTDREIGEELLDDFITLDEALSPHKEAILAAL